MPNSYQFIKIEALPELVDKKFNVEVISFNRPKVKNAFNPEMIAEITHYFSELNLKKPSVSAVVVRGEGTNFCAGADLAWMKDMANFSFEQNLKDSEKLWEMFESIAVCPVPVIGVAHGAVFGGAIGVLACCDYVIADEKSTHFCFSEVKLGLAPAVISSFILHKASEAILRPLMLSAEIFKCETALRAGLVHALIEENVGNTTNVEFAWPAKVKQLFAENGPQAMAATKKLLNDLGGLKDRLLKHKPMATTVISQLRVSSEAQQRLEQKLDQKLNQRLK